MTYLRRLYDGFDSQAKRTPNPSARSQLDLFIRRSDIQTMKTRRLPLKTSKTIGCPVRIWGLCLCFCERSQDWLRTTRALKGKLRRRGLSLVGGLNLASLSNREGLLYLTERFTPPFMATEPVSLVNRRAETVFPTAAKCCRSPLAEAYTPAAAPLTPPFLST